MQYACHVLPRAVENGRFSILRSETDILTRGKQRAWGISGIGRTTGSITTTVTTRGTIRIGRIGMLRIYVTRVSVYRTVKLQQLASATAITSFLDVFPSRDYRATRPADGLSFRRQHR